MCISPKARLKRKARTWMRVCSEKPSTTICPRWRGQTTSTQLHVKNYAHQRPPRGHLREKTTRIKLYELTARPGSSSYSSSTSSSSSCSSSFAAAAAALAAAGPFESGKAPEFSAVKQRTITALFGCKAQTSTSTSDTASSQHSGREQRIPAKFQLSGDFT